MGRTKSSSQFVLCLRNDGCDDLEVRKVYEVLADATAAEEGYLRVVDESGEDYLYPADHFAPIKLSDAAAKALAVPA